MIPEHDTVCLLVPKRLLEVLTEARSDFSPHHSGKIKEVEARFQSLSKDPVK